MAVIYDFKSRKEIKNKEQAMEEFVLLLEIANEYLKEAEKLQKEYDLKLY